MSLPNIETIWILERECRTFENEITLCAAVKFYVKISAIDSWADTEKCNNTRVMSLTLICLLSNVWFGVLALPLFLYNKVHVWTQNHPVNLQNIRIDGAIILPLTFDAVCDERALAHLKGNRFVLILASCLWTFHFTFKKKRGLEWIRSFADSYTISSPLKPTGQLSPNCKQWPNMLKRRPCSITVGIKWHRATGIDIRIHTGSFQFYNLRPSIRLIALT